MSPRTIHLRRPATLSIQEGVFVPETRPGIMDEVDRRWTDLCRANPEYYDGRLYHVLGVHRNGHGGASLHVIDCAYRFFAVQSGDFDVGVRALGVKGITRHDGMILFGLRSDRVAFYRNMWEFAPGGSVCPGDAPAQLVQQELLEEAGLRPQREPTSRAVLFDPILKCWELVFEMTTSSPDYKPRTEEYQQLAWRQPGDLPGELSPIAQQIAALLESSPRERPGRGRPHE